MKKLLICTLLVSTALLRSEDTKNGLLVPAVKNAELDKMAGYIQSSDTVLAQLEKDIKQIPDSSTHAFVEQLIKSERTKNKWLRDWVSTHYPQGKEKIEALQKKPAAEKNAKEYQPGSNIYDKSMRL